MTALASINQLIPRTATDQPSSNIKIIKKISDSKFPVFMIGNQETQTFFAMKVFQYEGADINSKFINEAKFASLSHPNIISILSTQEKEILPCKNTTVVASTIVMELAYADFFELIPQLKLEQDSTLLRSFFSQLVDGVEYLHEQGIAHMDLKPENLLLGLDCKLKIADFDLSHFKSTSNYEAHGTVNFRAPELMNDFVVVEFDKVDIFSMGIILFALNFGYMPFCENSTQGPDLLDLLLNNTEQFWEAHETMQGKPIEGDDGFMELFLSMTRKNPSERASLDEIRRSKWFQGSIYSTEQIQNQLNQILG